MEDEKKANEKHQLRGVLLTRVGLVNRYTQLIALCTELSEGETNEDSKAFLEIVSDIVIRHLGSVGTSKSDDNMRRFLKFYRHLPQEKDE